MRITFIGGGNMATALITGLAQDGAIAETVGVCDPEGEARERLTAAFGIRCAADPKDLVSGADVVVLAVKPQVMAEVLAGIAPHLDRSALVLSVAAGVTTGRIAEALGADASIVRAMPNTPALRGAGVTGLFAAAACSDHQRATAERLLRPTGACVWIGDETLMDAVTAVSGSGPAYFYLLTEALRDAGATLGLPLETADLLARRTAHGAGVMLRDEPADVAELRRRVTSPGGTTQAALERLEDGAFRALVLDAVRAANHRGRELSGDDDA